MLVRRKNTLSSCKLFYTKQCCCYVENMEIRWNLIKRCTTKSDLDIANPWLESRCQYSRVVIYHVMLGLPQTCEIASWLLVHSVIS